ncbi:MAG: PAS domain-containing protein, partial [Eubacteriales bacterium]|nr:PAS domain-containing protein [Eubacteriales bacterium]
MNEPTDFPARGKTKENMEELKRAEKKLEAAEERLKEETALWRLLLEQSRDGIVIVDENGGVFEANRRFAEMLGCSLDEVYFLKVWDWDGRFPREQ